MQTDTALEDIERAVAWLLGFIALDGWTERRLRIENEYADIVRPRANPASEMAPLSIRSDRIGWYLFLADAALRSSPAYEPVQGSRVLPIFAFLGKHLEVAKAIEGLEPRIRRLLAINSDADSGLFELLIAMLWMRNGWSAKFIEEDPPAKRPDMLAHRGGEVWHVECKRFSQSSEYSRNERERWLAMWRHLSEYLKTKRQPCVIDVTFHVEIETLPEYYLVETLRSKLELAVVPGLLISNGVWDVSYDLVDMDRVRTYMKDSYVMMPSDQLNLLIAGRREPNKGFSSVVLGKRVNSDNVFFANRYLSEIEYAAGAFWDCDADVSIEKKARHLRRRLSEAIRQLPINESSAVHIGLETLDGPLVERVRRDRVMGEVVNFDPNGRKLKGVYCHLYQSYSPPDQFFVVDETVYYFQDVAGYPLNEFKSLAEESHGDVPHWLRAPP